MRDWILSETNYGFVRDNPYQVAVLPMGATEPHNLHLPYGTDIFEADQIAARAGEAAWARGARVIVLPTIPYGTQTNQHAFPLAMNLYPSTLARVISDLVESVHRADMVHAGGDEAFSVGVDHEPDTVDPLDVNESLAPDEVGIFAFRFRTL